MKRAQLERYKQALEDLLDRVTDEVNHVVESIHQDIDIAEHESSAPVHLADFAPEAVDADVRVLATERDIRSQIRDALARIADGTFGQCQSCGGEISPKRLNAVPYTPLCIVCAAAKEAPSSPLPEGVPPVRLTGFEAIEYAEKEGLTLNKAGDSIDEAVRGLSVAEAEAIADEDPELIWLEVPGEEYYGQPRNMDHGTIASSQPGRRAGQRRDELAPGEDSGSAARDRGAIGTPGGGMASGGLAGTNAPDAVPDGGELEDAMTSGPDDHSGDRISSDEPQSGRAGGAVGGTPAGKRTRGR